MTKQRLTRGRDLREAHPLWLDSPRISVRTKKHAASSRYDVIVVGAGISGALMANALAEQGKSMLIVDKRQVIRGSSIASTAMIQHEIDTPLHRLQQMIGAEKADRVWRRSAMSVLRLHEIAEELGIACAMRRKKALYLAGDDLGARALRTEVEARNKADIAADFIEAQDLEARYGLERSGAILSDISASANPGQLTAGLLRSVIRRGAEIVAGVEITDLKSIGADVALATADGKLFSAGHVVFCTGYEFLETLASKKHQIVSTWALASKPGIALPGWLRDHILWEASDPYLYMRTDREGRLIAGGEDEDDPEAFQSPSRLRSKTDTIRRKIAKLIGHDIGEPDYRWAAPFGTTTDGLPIIGVVPGLDNVYAVMGFGGNGITFSQIAAELIAAEIKGKPDADAGLFRPE